MARAKSYPETYAEWQRDTESYWADAARAIDWVKPFDRVFDSSVPPFGRWFTRGMLNINANCLDRHIAANAGERVALIWDSAMEGRISRYTYRELRDRAVEPAGALAARDVQKGDRQRAAGPAALIAGHDEDYLEAEAAATPHAPFRWPPPLHNVGNHRQAQGHRPR